MIDWWLIDDWLMIDWWLIDDLLFIDQWLIDDWLMIDLWLIDDWLMIDYTRSMLVLVTYLACASNMPTNWLKYVWLLAKYEKSDERKTAKFRVRVRVSVRPRWNGGHFKKSCKPFL